MVQTLLVGRRRLAAAVLATVVVAVMTVIVTRGWVTASAQAAEPWPAFTMTWRETGVGLGLNGVRGTQLLRLEYIDRRHYRLTLLENPAVPDAVGSTSAINGNVATSYNARFGRSTTQVLSDKPNEFAAPADWLIPGKINDLRGRPGYISVPLGNGQAMLRHEETAPDGKVRRQEITYRLVDGIPLGRTSSINGVEVSRIQVVDFKLGATP